MDPSTRKHGMGGKASQTLRLGVDRRIRIRGLRVGGVWSCIELRVGLRREGGRRMSKVAMRNVHRGSLQAGI